MARPKIKVKEYEYTFKYKDNDWFDCRDKFTGEIKKPKSNRLVSWREERYVKNNIDFDKENNPYWDWYEYTLTGNVREVKREMDDEEYIEYLEKKVKDKNVKKINRRKTK